MISYIIILSLHSLFREQQIIQKWQNLLDQLQKRKRVLDGFSVQLSLFREIEGIHAEIKEIEVTAFLEILKRIQNIYF